MAQQTAPQHASVPGYYDPAPDNHSLFMAAKRDPQAGVNTWRTRMDEYKRGHETIEAMCDPSCPVVCEHMGEAVWTLARKMQVMLEAQTNNPVSRTGEPELPSVDVVDSYVRDLRTLASVLEVRMHG